MRESVLDRLINDGRIVDRTRFDHKDKELLEREWEVLRAVGAKSIIRDLFRLQSFKENYHITETELITKWNDFVDKSLVTAKAILEDLKTDPPDEVVFDQYSEEAGKSVASMGITPDGEHVLNFSSVPLLVFFMRYIGNEKTKEFQKSAAWYDFQSVIAHEFRHLKQHRQYSSVTDRNLEKPYIERLTEYDARLYSLKWLRKQKAETVSEQLGLWFARTRVLVENLSPFNAVRDKVNEKFGAPKPTKWDGLKAIFTSA